MHVPFSALTKWEMLRRVVRRAASSCVASTLHAAARSGEKGEGVAVGESRVCGEAPDHCERASVRRAQGVALRAMLGPLPSSRCGQRSTAGVTRGRNERVSGSTERAEAHLAWPKGQVGSRAAASCQVASVGQRRRRRGEARRLRACE